MFQYGGPHGRGNLIDRYLFLALFSFFHLSAHQLSRLVEPQVDRPALALQLCQVGGAWLPVSRYRDCGPLLHAEQLVDSRPLPAAGKRPGNSTGKLPAIDPAFYGQDLTVEKNLQVQPPAPLLQPDLVDHERLGSGPRVGQLRLGETIPDRPAHRPRQRRLPLPRSGLHDVPAHQHTRQKNRKDHNADQLSIPHAPCSFVAKGSMSGRRLRQNTRAVSRRWPVSCRLTRSGPSAPPRRYRTCRPCTTCSARRCRGPRRPWPAPPRPCAGRR